MANSFSKQETVAFEDIMSGFEDALILSNAVSIHSTDSETMERSSDVIWRPQPYVATSYAGQDQTANFNDYTQLSVPATLGFTRSVPWAMNARELRDAMQENRLGAAAKQKLASDINVAINNVVCAQGSIVVKRTVAASGYDDVAQMEAAFNEQGVNSFERFGAVSTRDYNGMASNLAGRQTLGDKSKTAYEKSLIGQVASFDLFKLDYAPRLTAAAASGVTVNGAGQYYVPKATSVALSGESSNVDNRFQNLAITVASGIVKVGDCFTIAGVTALHHISKQDSGQPKTFRVTGIVSGNGGTGVIQITPPIISGSGGSGAEMAYQNVNATPANGAALTWLNTSSAFMNPFWQKSAIELLPGSLAVPSDSGAAVIRASTDNGIEVVFQKFYDINTSKTKFRVDVLFGVANLQPEMSGIMLFNQT